MREIINIKHEETLKKSISEVTSISIDIDYDIEGYFVEGEFNINGTYKSHGLSLNQDTFNFKIPFSHRVEDNIVSESIKTEIEDFTYTIDAYDLCLDITYKITGEEKQEDFDDLEEFNRFLDEHEVDVIDFKEEEIEEAEEPRVEHLTEEIPFIEEKIIEENIIENKIINEETYITYHIYICNESDTLESIANKYNVSIDLIKEYNEINTITLGTKLIIPFSNE